MQPIVVRRCVQAFMEVTKNYVSSQIFTSYIHKLQTDHNRLWLFKKQLCKNLALSGGSPLPLTLLYPAGMLQVFCSGLRPPQHVERLSMWSTRRFV